MRSHLRRAAAFIAVLWIIGACSKDLGAPVRCETDEQCSNMGGYCYRGVCVAACVDSTTCLPGRLCLQGRCQDEESVCQNSNGGCDRNATCTIADRQRLCTCLPGFSGDGFSCTRLAPSWSHPLPTGENYAAVWAPGLSEAWAVGTFGTLAAFDGARWSLLERVTSEDLYDIWGSSEGTLWAVGSNGTLLKRHAGLWSRQTSPTAARLSAVWGTGEADVWAAGDSGMAIHWDGSTWTQKPAPTTQRLTDLAGTGSSEVIAVGAGGVIFLWNGETWSSVTSPTTSDIHSIWRGGTDTWIATSHNVYRKSVSGTWSSPVYTTTGTLTSLWATDPSRVWLAETLSGSDGIVDILKYNGSAFDVSTSVRAYRLRLGGTLADAVWAVGTQGTTATWRGASWEHLTEPGLRQNISAIAFETTGSPWIGSNDGVMAQRENNWDADRNFTDVREIFAASDGRVWASSCPGLYSESPVNRFYVREGGAWKQKGSSFTGECAGAFFESGGFLYSVDAYGPVRRWSGLDWEQVDSANYQSVSTFGQEVWGIGEQGLVRFRDGAFTTVIPKPSQCADWLAFGQSAWSSGYPNAWFVCGPLVLRWDADRWTQTLDLRDWGSAPGESFASIRGTSQGDVWVVGTFGRIAHYDGQAWEQVPAVTARHLNMVAIGANEVWFLGDSGTVLTIAH